jgi:hypothetical protein
VSAVPLRTHIVAWLAYHDDHASVASHNGYCYVFVLGCGSDGCVLVLPMGEDGEARETQFFVYAKPTCPWSGDSGKHLPTAVICNRECDLWDGMDAGKSGGGGARADAGVGISTL